MFNYSIMRLSYLHITGVLFVTGVTIGGFGGITLGILSQDVVGILGGAFIGLVAGLGCAMLGLIFTAVFNLLSPYIGGLPVRLDTLPAPEVTSSTAEPPPDTKVSQNISA